MKKNNYEELDEIIVKNQKELDDIPASFNGTIYIEFGTWNNKAQITKKYNGSVVARGNSSVVARGNSSVVAWDNSSVDAWDNSSVVARGNSSVDARGNCQVVDRLNGGKIKLNGNARKVYMPKNIFEFMDFYGIKHTKKTAIFYKAVRNINGKYVSDYDRAFEYKISGLKTETCDNDVNNECSFGINISHLYWALEFGKNWDNLAILEVKVNIDDIIMPKDTDGKVRTSKIKVIREVLLEECGVYGKILSRRKK